MIHEQIINLNMETAQIILQAFQAFCARTGTRVELLRPNQVTKVAPAKILAETDGAIEIQPGKHKARFLVELKNEIRDVHVARLIEKMRPVEQWLLVCQYIPGPVKETLKNQGLNYLEAAGNCYINTAPFYFFINDQAVTEFRGTKNGKLWKPAGLKFLFAVLQDPDLINAPYRELAQAAGIALGNIGDFLDELQNEGFAKKGNHDGAPLLFLENKTQLLNQWVELYNVVLKPKIKKGRFRFMDDPGAKQWKKIKLEQAAWGGEPAGNLLTKFLEPEQFTLYTNGPNQPIMKALRLLPDPTGNIELFDMFWPAGQNANRDTVPPMLAYADLVTSTESRNRETAQRIKQQYLA